MNRVLMVDDDGELCELVSEYLAREGWTVDAVHDGEAALEQLENGEYVAIILDVMLPGLGGFEVLRRVRSRSEIPVVMLTARGDEVDRVLGLELGADDYLPKPFSSRELAARLRAILRRSHNEAAVEETRPRQVLRVGDVEVDVAARSAKRGGESLDLTSVEWSLLELLLRNAGEVVTRERIANDVLGRRLMPYDRSVDTHLSNLRRKLDPQEGFGSERIKTIRGTGYIYTQPAQ
ncbi:MAG TPA: response regulator transcription factor [Abditibacteriaceae bacterium]